MTPTSKWSAILVAVLAAMLFAGITHLFFIRFSRGDVYPPYSSLRADPLGTRALYESIRRLNDVDIKRDFTPVDRIQAAAPATMFAVGLSPAQGMGPDGMAIRRRAVDLAENGIRVVIAFKTHHAHGEGDDDPPPDTCCDASDGADLPQDDGAEDATCVPASSYMEGLRLVRLDAAETSETRARRGAAAPLELPAELRWHGSWHFEIADDAWSVIYERSGNPVVVERRYNHGSIVICTDSFAFSNESLWRDRATAYLVWLLGGAEHVVFIEAHHGLREKVGVMQLIRAFRLHGILAGLFILAWLFVWQQQKPFPAPLPVAEQVDTATGVQGRDAYSGMISLLQRSVSLRSLGRTCVDTWAVDRRRRDRHAAGAEQRLRQYLAQAARNGHSDPVLLYHELSKQIQERKSM